MRGETKMHRRVGILFATTVLIFFRVGRLQNADRVG
jgi:hypothetical protein